MQIMAALGEVRTYLPDRVLCIVEAATSFPPIGSPQSLPDVRSKIPKRIQVLQPNNAHAFWASPDEATQLVKSGAAELLGKRRAYAIRMKAKDLKVYPTCGGSVQALMGQRYVHRHDVSADAGIWGNPENVWTFRRLDAADREIFLQSQLDCMPPADREDFVAALRKAAKRD